jgi:hypothetical protein
VGSVGVGYGPRRTCETAERGSVHIFPYIKLYKAQSDDTGGRSPCECADGGRELLETPEADELDDADADLECAAAGM